MRTNFTVTILIVFLFLICAGAVVRADQNLFGLDTANSYDIYLGSDEKSGLTVIRDVTILETREIRGEVFILIQSDSFASRLNQGLVRFSAVQAVLPSKRAFKIDGTTKFLQ